MSNSTRAPTPAETWVSPMAAFSNGDLFPYWNLKNDGLSPYINAFKRTFASINPVSEQQIPTSERIGLGIKYGGGFYKDQPYPNSIHWTSRFPSHYNPLDDERFKARPHTKHYTGKNFVVGREKILPRFCTRQMKLYKRCLVANDDREDVCKQQQDNILSVCPAFALEYLRQSKLASIKNEGLSNKKYKEVMVVPAYNKGRTVADVPLRSWADGINGNLRPSTLWADERYNDITDEEVKAAKERLKKRRAANPEKIQENKSYDRTYEVPPKPQTFQI